MRICDRIDEERFVEEGIGLGKETARSDHRENRSVTPEIIALDRYTAIEDERERSRPVTRM